jgi:hypothetical protein
MIKQLGMKDKKQPNQLFAEQKIIKNLNQFTNDKPEEVKELNEKTLRYTELLKKLKLRNWVLQKGRFNTLSIFGQGLLLVIFLPIYLIGGLINYLPYKLPVWLSRKIQDPQFVSSVRTVISIIFFPIYYIILTVISVILSDLLWIHIAIPVLLPIAGLFAFHYYIEARKVFARIRFKIKTLTKNKDLSELKNLYTFIVQKMENIS